MVFPLPRCPLCADFRQKPFDVTRVVRPSILMAVNDSAGTAVGSRISKGWLNLGNSSVPHFGIKYIFEGISGGSSDPVNGVKIEMKIEAKFYLAFKEVR